MSFLRRSLFLLIPFFFLYSLNNSNAFEKTYTEFDDEVFAHIRGEEPTMFVGYRPWRNANAFIKVDDTEEVNPIKIIVRLHAPGAFEYAVSSYRDFRGAKWKKMVEKLTWDLEIYKRATVLWFVFKRKNEETGKYEVTEPISYIYFRGDVHKKAMVIEKGYWDLSEQTVVNFSNVVSDVPNNARYNYGSSEMNLKAQSVKDSYAFLKSIMINRNFYLDYLFPQDDSRFLDRFYSIIKYARIAYDESQNAEALYYFNLFSPEKRGDGLNVYRFAKENFYFDPIQLGEDSSDEIYQYLVIDMRGVAHFKPSLFPIVQTKQGEIIFDAGGYESFDKPFVRYYRGSNVNVPDIAKNRAGQRFLFVEGIGTLPLDASTIVVENYNKAKIQANEKSFKNFSNGNLYILVN